MDIGTLKNYSDLAHDLAQTKRNALEKMRSRQIIAYNERLFRADAETINVVQTFYIIFAYTEYILCELEFSQCYNYYINEIFSSYSSYYVCFPSGDNR